MTFIFLGFGLGAVYVGIGMGLLLTYRATAIVNFAQAGIGAWGAYVYVMLRETGTLMFPVGSVNLGGPVDVLPAVIGGTLSSAVLGVLSYLLVFRLVRHAPELAQVVASIALLLVITALLLIRFGPTQARVPTVVPEGRLAIGELTLSSRELWFVALMFICSLAVWGYLRFTRMGIATRASAENERAVLLMGYSTHRLATVAMAAGGAVSAFGIMLGCSLTGLSATNVSGFLVPATAVLLLARMQSVWVILLGGLALGAVQSMLNLLTATADWWPRWASSGIDYVLFFALVVGILFIRGARLPARGSLQTVRLPDVRVPSGRPWKILIIGAVGAIVLSIFSGDLRLGLTNSLIMMLLCLSYVLITGYLGQVSLAQVAFAGAAGFILSRITMTWGMPFPLNMLIAAAGAALLGLLVAFPAFRIRGAELAIVTLAAAIAIERFVFGNPSFSPVEGNHVPPPSLLGMDLAPVVGAQLHRFEFSLLVLVVVVLMTLLCVRIFAGRSGRAFLAVRANERAAASVGVNVRLAKATGFFLSAFLAGIAGTLIGFSQFQVSTASFGYMVGLNLLAVAYLGGITTIGGALVAGIMAPSGIFYTLTHQWLSIGDYYALASGLLLILTVVLNPTGIAGETVRQWERFVGRRKHGDTQTTPPDPLVLEAERATVPYSDGSKV